jgi:hypothetical protein
MNNKYKLSIETTNENGVHEKGFTKYELTKGESIDLFEALVETLEEYDKL